jgi:DNA polymerase-3 subunit gamma/tau
MSYLVLARKWRPQVFDTVIGQEHVTKTLKNAITQNRVAHAFVFTGARGVGKTSVARILAKALNCGEGPTAIPCNQCHSCKEISNGSSVDVYEIDGASNRGINEIRELRENVKYLPSRDRYKIFIIDEVHMLTQEAFNALLKTLEEPPPHVIFVMATTQPHKVPATILSRCQRFDFRRIPLQGILSQLQTITDNENSDISETALRVIAQKAEGSMRDALSLLDQVISFSSERVTDREITDILGIIDRELVWDAAEAIISGDVPKCLDIVDRVYTHGYDMKQFCQDLTTQFRNLMVAKIAKEPKLLIDLPHGDLKRLGKTADTMNLETLQYYFYTLLEGIKDIKQIEPSRVVLEMLLIRMAYVAPVVALDEIMAKLDSLEEEFTALGKKSAPMPEPTQIARVNRDEVSREDDKDIIMPDTWKDVLRFIRQNNLLLASMLERASPSWLDEETITLRFRGGSFNFEMVNETYRTRLESLLSEFFKKNVRVHVTGEDGKNKNVLSKQQVMDKMADKTEGASNHSIVNEILEIFGGKIGSGERKP